MAVLIPMTSPRRFTSGPPELPGLIDASVWMKFSYVAIPTSARPFALTTPTVTPRPEELVEEVLEKRVLGKGTGRHWRPTTPRHLHRADVDDGGPDVLGDAHEG